MSDYDLSVRTNPPIVPDQPAPVDHGSIFQIDEQLDALLATRQDMLEADPPEDTSAIDVEIIKYFQAGVVKIDHIRGWILHGRSLVTTRREEYRRLKASADSWDARLDHLEMRLIEHMRGLNPPKKRLEGQRGSIIRRTNGGNAALEIYNPLLLPDEVCDMVGFLTAAQWQRVPQHVREWLGTNLQRTPNNAAIREALAKPCSICDGAGDVADGPGRVACPHCNGSKLARVPGARLVRGEHIKIS